MPPKKKPQKIKDEPAKKKPVAKKKPIATKKPATKKNSAVIVAPSIPPPPTKPSTTSVLSPSTKKVIKEIFAKKPTEDEWTPDIEAHNLNHEGDSQDELNQPKDTRVHFYRNIALGFLAITVVLFGAVFLLSTKKVTITIATRPSISEAESVVKVAPDRTDLNSILGEVQIWQDTYAKDFQPESVREEPGIAKGKVTLHNETNRAQPLVATTRLLNPEGVLFRLKSAANVPANGTTETEVYADQSGEQNNIEPGKFTIPGLAASKQEVIYATSDTAMEGGVKRIGILGEDDVDRAKEEFKNIFNDFITEKAKMLLTEHSGIIVEIQNTTTEVNGEVGNEIDRFSLIGKARVIAIGYDERELTQWANTKLKEKIGRTKLTVNIPENPPEINFDGLSEDELSARLIVKRKGELHLDKDNPLIAPSAFVGKSSRQAKDYLGQVPGIEAVTIEFFPKWLKNAPSNPDKITVKVVDSLQNLK